MNDAHHPLNALPQGHRLQEYELVRVLGFGGFGMTYLGFDHNLDKGVAVKEYLPDDIAARTGDNSVVPKASQFRGDFEWGLERFLDEARTLARFDHRHIIKVFRFFEAHGTAYIVMEYAEGETLSAFLARKGTLSEAELKTILYPILDGLEVVHRADFLHRDIKPGNIIIRDEDNSPVLLDFGAARQAIGAKSRSVTSIITPGYAPIEQYSSRGDQGAWTDIYALGGVCYQALIGEVPDDATDRVRTDPLIPLSERCAGQASAGFLSAIDWALRVDEVDRPQSVAAWRPALSGETSGSVNIPPPVTASAQERERVDAPPVHQRDDARSGSLKKRKGKWLAAVVCMVALLVGGLYYYEYEYVPEQRRQAQEVEEAEAARGRAEKVSVLLSGAATDLASDRLTSPAGNNAWEKYQSVLELEPGHGVATAGLDSIIGRYVVMFEGALGRKEFDKADEYVSRIRGVWVDAPVLSGLEGRLSESRQEEAEKARQAAEEAKKRRQEEAEKARQAAEEAKKRRQEEAEKARQAAEEAKKRRQEQEAEKARQAAEEAKKRRQEQGVGRTFRDCVECPQIVVVPSGSFTMGSPSNEAGRYDDEGAQHVVRIEYRLAVGVNEVTFAEWAACVAGGGCRGYRPDDEGWGRGNRPVINVSWNDAQSYVSWLSKRTGKSYRLLSESEWEYVARAGSVTAYSWGNDIGHNRANCDGCGSRWDNKKTAPVGAFSANAWGLYDVHGNVWEWVEDCQNDSYYGAPEDGSAWESGNCSGRVLRGGSWFNRPRGLRSAYRDRVRIESRAYYSGFRVARTLTP